MKECVLITSVVHTTNNPLNYSETRSIYSHQERFEQTLETIESIKKYLPDANIMIVECSQNSSYIENLKSKVNHFLNLEFNESVNLKKEKGEGEATLLLNALTFLKDKYDAIYKITGRYVLQPSFNKEDWLSQHGITACRTSQYGMKDSIHTFFYKVPNKFINLFKKTLTKYVSNSSVSCIENFMAVHLKSDINFIDHIGILVRWSCYNEQTYF
jgi:hypothetical protein